MRWKTTVSLLVATIGVGAFISLYEIRRPGTEEHSRRSLELLNLSPESVTRIDIQTSSASIGLSRDGARWWLEPQHARANEELITQLLNETDWLRAQRLLSSTPEKPLDLKSLGLDPAMAQLTLTADGKTATLLLGEATPVGNNRYAQLADRPEVAIIAPGLFEVVTRPAETFRDPMLLRFDTWTTDAVTVTTPTRTIAMARTGMDWRISHHEHDLVASLPVDDRADRAAVMNFLSQVAGLRMTRILDDAPQAEQILAWGFDAPSAEVALTLQTDPPSSLTVFFGKPLPNDPALLYAKRSDEPTLYAVPASSMDTFMLNPNTLRAKACLEFFAGEVTKVEVLQGTDGWTIERKDGAWHSVSDTKLATEATSALVSDTVLEAERVETFLNTLADLRLLEFVEERPTDLARYGLAPPAGMISVWTANPDAPQRLLVGTAVDVSPNRYGRIEGREPVVTLPETITTLRSTPLSQFQPPPAPTPPPQPDPVSPPAPQ